MKPVLVMALLWAAFCVTHVGPAVSGLRAQVSRRFGKLAFTIGFALVAQVAFSALCVWYATHRDEGPPGPALGRAPLLTGPLVAATVLGWVLIIGACAPRQ